MLLFIMFTTQCTQYIYAVAHACLLQKESRCDYHHHIIALSIHLLAHTKSINIFWFTKTRGSKLVRIYAVIAIKRYRETFKTSDVVDFFDHHCSRLEMTRKEEMSKKKFAPKLTYTCCTLTLIIK